MISFTRTLLLPLAALALATGSASASPIAEKRDVFVPPVTYPHAGTVWHSGQTHHVTWDTSAAPVNITNKVGRIYLRFHGITTPLILAENFNILDGRVKVTVPLVDDRDDYGIVLFGDSGNFSPQFTILSD
ncbi:uncharacterized protein BXZ73DRAFT_102286 [Epithele typhae]|uniref:uncharacterized protein n=1 Tax=Epithele typhae TaxID=378194 RepID=UPI002007571F|nr:uncharacterized protein BXZ73DRAFT_102286 [Epithele typhae]KAH9928444.1 hypothetical protein BXZ73DRAFT_102286 [Epithele typhae]